MEIIIFFLPLTACSHINKPSRSEAARQIKEALEKEKITHAITLGNINGKKIYGYSHINNYNEGHKNHELGKQFVGDPDRFIELSAKGLIDYKVLRLKQYDGHERYKDWIEISLTHKGKKYATEKMEKSIRDNKISKMAVARLAELDGVEITDINAPSDARGTKYTRVMYISKYNLTPFGEVFKDRVKLTRKGYVYFLLYDDGWRWTTLENRDISF